MHDPLTRHAVHVTGDPGAQPMVFAHGFGCDQTLWRFVTPAFADDYRVVTFNYVGAGRSDRSTYDPIRYRDLDGYAQDILAICRDLELEATFCSIDPVMARQFAEVTFLSDNRADLARVSVPSLILQVSDDVVAPIEVDRYLHARLAASTFRVIEGTGHCPHVSHPEESIRAIREYLAERRSQAIPA